MQQPSAPTGQSNNPLANLPGGLNQKKLIYIVVGVVVLGGLGMLLKGMLSRNAAEFAVERAIERATGGNVDVDYNGDGTVTYKGEDGEVQVGTNAQLPSDWPSDVPVMPGATIGYSGTSNPTTGAAGATVMFTTSKSVAEVVTYYNTELVSQGWTIDATTNLANTTVISAKKAGRTAGMYIAGAEGTTTVTIGVQQE